MIRENNQRAEQQIILGIIREIFLSFAIEIGARSSFAIVRRSKM